MQALTLLTIKIVYSNTFHSIIQLCTPLLPLPVHLPTPLPSLDYTPPEWIQQKRPQLSPYLPQVGDFVSYWLTMTSVAS